MYVCIYIYVCVCVCVKITNFAIRIILSSRHSHICPISPVKVEKVIAKEMHSSAAPIAENHVDRQSKSIPSASIEPTPSSPPANEREEHDTAHAHLEHLLYEKIETKMLLHTAIICVVVVACTFFLSR